MGEDPSSSHSPKMAGWGPAVQSSVFLDSGIDVPPCLRTTSGGLLLHMAMFNPSKALRLAIKVFVRCVCVRGGARGCEYVLARVCVNAGVYVYGC